MIAKNAGGSRKKKANAKSKGGIATKVLPFADLVEAADHLSEEEQEELVAIVQRRLREAARKRLVAEAQEALREFEDGRCKPVTPEELMREILK